MLDLVYRKKQLGPLEQFDEQKLQLLGELFQFVQFQHGQVVFNEGDDGDSFFIIVYGEVKMESTSPVSPVCPAFVFLLADVATGRSCYRSRPPAGQRLVW